jgi:nitrogenase molybdenum-iron protein alpha/beta subunit
MESAIITPLNRPSEANAELASCAVVDSYKRCPVYGAALVSAEIYDSMCYLHGAQGCTQPVREAYALQNREYPYNHSAMGQTSIVFGGEKTLISALLETITPYERAGPLILVNTCAPEIIGDDLNGLVSRINPRIPIVAVSGGFRRDHFWGIDETLLQLVKKFSDPYVLQEADVVNLVGNIGGSRQWRADVHEMSRLLSELGFTVNRLGCDNGLDDLRRVSRAAATVLITPEIGIPAAEYLQHTFGQQVITSPLGLPLGLRGTEVWLRTVGEQLNVDANRLDAVVAREEDAVRRRLKIGLSDMVFTEKTAQLKQLRVAVVADGICASSWARFLAEEMETIPCAVGLRTRIPKQEYHPDLAAWFTSSGACRVLEESDVATVRQALAKERPQIVLGSTLEGDFVRELGLSAFLDIAYPNNRYVNITDHPYLGYRGMLHACQQILNRI